MLVMVSGPYAAEAGGAEREVFERRGLPVYGDAREIPPAEGAQGAKV